MTEAKTATATIQEEEEEIKQPPQRAQFLSVTFTRKANDGPLGLVIAESRVTPGEFYVKKVNAGKVLSSSLFRVGDILLTINHVPCSKYDFDGIKKLLRSMYGRLTIVAKHELGNPQMVESQVLKHAEEAIDDFGIRFGKDENGQTSIMEIDDDGLFSESLLAVGDVCLFVNGISCSDMNPALMRGYMENTSGFLSIVSLTPEIMAFEESATEKELPP